jgi:FkbM family methyltransferase
MSIIGKVLKFIFYTSFQEKKLFVKDNILLNSNENLLRAVLFLKKANTQTNSKLIIDIGAFDGKSALFLSSCFGGNEILAIEANDRMFKVLKKSVEKNKKITPLNYAVTSKTGPIDFYVTKNLVSSSINETNSDHSIKLGNELQVDRKEIVNGIRLDDLNVLQEILLIKIDTQGHEMEVLKGAIDTLTRTSSVLVEMGNHDYYSKGSKYFEVDNFLRSINFVLVDVIVTYREKGIAMREYDALYFNRNKFDIKELKLI